jgi:CDP-2,3-bis-(O-geranylgeranyl)-sn-glycerol synthase
MNLRAIFSVLFLLALANGGPVIAKRLLGEKIAWPIDGGIRFFDGRPVFGRSKTVRGLLVGVALPAIAAPFVGLHWTEGELIGLASLGGDLLSSFTKRRMGMAPSSQALGLDQIPESLLPALISMNLLGLTLADVLAITILFLVGALLTSKAFYTLKVRDRPY